MKKKHKSKVKQHKPRYEYILPQDEQQLIIDAIAHGDIDSIRDGINDKSSDELDIQARLKCEQLKMATQAECVANDFEYFTRVFVSAYIDSYFEKQKRFKANTNLYKTDLKAVHDLGGWQAAYLAYRGHIERTTKYLGQVMGARSV